MGFSFSKRFNLSLYRTLLKDLSKEMEDYRYLSGSRIKEMKTDLCVGYETLKKCSTAKTSAHSTMWLSFSTFSVACAATTR